MTTAPIDGYTQQSPDLFERLLFAVVLILGVWGIYAQITVLLGRSFLDLQAGTWIPMLATVLIAFALRGTQRLNPAGIEEPKSNGLSERRILGMALLVALCLLIGGPGSPLAAGGYVSVTLLLLWMVGDHGREPAIPRESDRDKYAPIVVWLVVIAAITVALGEHKANWDDANYLQTVANTLEHKGQPLLLYENVHGVEELKINHPAWRLQTYLLLVAGLADGLGVSYLKMYYLFLPPIWAGLAVLAQWSLLRRIAGRHAGLALITTFVVLSTWGSYRSFGSFSFAQLYTGRAVFLTFAVPALVSASLHFAERSNFRSWLYLFLTTWMGCFFSSTAYAVAPVAVALTLVACYGATLRTFRRLAAGALTVAWCPLLMAYTVWVVPVVAAVDVDSRGGVHWIFSGEQGLFALLLLGLAPFFVVLVRLQSSRWILRYSALTFLIFFSGVVLDFAGRLFTGLSWRMVWAVPVPALIGVGSAAGIDFISGRLTQGRLLKMGISVALVALVGATFSLTGDTVVFRNFGWPRLKMDTSAFQAARVVVQCSKSTDLVLAPKRLAVPLAGLIGAPPLVGVRGHFLSRLSAQWGEEETRQRRILFRMVHGRDVSPENVTWAGDEISKRSIRRIVLYRHDDKTEPFRELLRSRGISRAEVGSWEIWLPNHSAEEAAGAGKCLQSANEAKKNSKPV